MPTEERGEAGSQGPKEADGERGGGGGDGVRTGDEKDDKVGMISRELFHYILDPPGDPGKKKAQAHTCTFVFVLPIFVHLQNADSIWIERGRTRYSFVACCSHVTSSINHASLSRKSTVRAPNKERL